MGDEDGVHVWGAPEDDVALLKSEIDGLRVELDRLRRENRAMRETVDGIKRQERAGVRPVSGGGEREGDAEEYIYISNPSSPSWVRDAFEAKWLNPPPIPDSFRTVIPPTD